MVGTQSAHIQTSGIRGQHQNQRELGNGMDHLMVGIKRNETQTTISSYQPKDHE